MKKLALGIDIGGSGVKGAIVDLKNGDFASDRLRIPTPEPSTPEAVTAVVAEIVKHFDEIQPGLPIGITVPGMVKRGVVHFVGNLHQDWVGLDVAKVFGAAVGREVFVLNDADAAGLAEAACGAAKGQQGVVLVTTLGTGIGTAIINDGVLLPNTELGHLEINGKPAEPSTSSAARTREGLSLEEWATTRLQPYYAKLEMYFSPDLFVVGGGVSKKSDQFLPLLDLKAPIIPAKLLNRAGIVGAARYAYQANKQLLKEQKKAEKASTKAKTQK